MNIRGWRTRLRNCLSPDDFDGDENAIVDFKYSTDPRLTWWFDHHQSAFLTPEDAEHFRRDTSGRKMYDPSFRSCTKYIATVARERFGFDAPDLAELVAWADIVDGAQYASAEEAVNLTAPAMRLTLVIEGAKGSEIVQTIIRMMRQPQAGRHRGGSGDPGGLPAAVRAPSALHRHHRTAGAVPTMAWCISTWWVMSWRDITSSSPTIYFRESVYTVSVSTSSFRTKVSVGSNPWAKKPVNFNLASICERYGGGGHPARGRDQLREGGRGGGPQSRRRDRRRTAHLSSGAGLRLTPELQRSRRVRCRGPASAGLPPLLSPPENSQ